MTELHVRVHGRPAPEGSHEVGANGRVMHSSNYLGAWRHAVNRDTRKSYLAAGYTGRDMPLIPYPQPVYLLVAHWVGDEQCRAEGTEEPTGTPDFDKLLRATVDGLAEARVFGNDSQVKAAMTSKVRGETPGADIIISDTPIRRITRDQGESMSDEYRVVLERVVGRDENGFPATVTVIEATDTAEALGEIYLPAIVRRLGATVPVTAPASEQDTAPKTAKRAPKKAAPPPVVAEPTVPDQATQTVTYDTPPVAAPAAVPVNPFAR